MGAFSTQFADNFFGLQSALLSAQFSENAKRSDQLAVNNSLALQLVSASQANTNSFFYGLAAQQTSYMNALGNRYAAISEQNVRNAGKRGWFSKIFG